MGLVFRLVYAAAAVLATAAAALVTASLFIADRAPQSTTFLGISLVVSGAFLSVGVVLFGIQRHGVAAAAAVRGRGGESAAQAAMHLRRLGAYLVVGGVLVCAVLGILTYAILARIDQGFAVFG